MAKPRRSTFQTRFKDMVAALRSEIENGIYKPGDYLPSELELTARFQLSKKSVRTALDVLLKEGLIAKVPRVGTQVLQKPSAIALRIAIYPTLHREAAMAELLQMFQEQNPGIRIEIITVHYANAETLMNLLQFKLVDVIALHLKDFMHFKENGCLNLLAPQPKKPGAYPFLNELFSNGGESVYCQPFVFSPVIMCYNKAHFAERGVFEPDSGWDWRMFREQLKLLKKEDRCSLYFSLASFNRWPIFFLQNGGRFLRDESGKTSVPEPEKTLGMLRMLRELIHEEGMFPLTMAFGQDEPEALFKQQKVSVIFTTYFGLNALKDADFRFDISQLPHGQTDSTLLLCTGIAISKETDHPEAARRLADFLTSDEVQSKLRKATFSLPANKRIAENEQTQIPNKPARLELHRELVRSYATFEHMGLSMSEMLALGEGLRRYFSHLAADEEMFAMLAGKKKIEQMS